MAFCWGTRCTHFPIIAHLRYPHIPVHQKSFGSADAEPQVMTSEAAYRLYTSHVKWEQTGKSCSLTNGARMYGAVEPDSFAIAAVKDALLAIFSRPVINHLTPPRGATDRAADGQMSHDKSSACRWHQSLAMPFFRLPAPSRETQSDNSFVPISSVFSVV